jgi:hypothetical protein
MPALKRWRQEDGEFEASLGYILRTCLKNKERKKSLLDTLHHFCM